MLRRTILLAGLAGIATPVMAQTPESAGDEQPAGVRLGPPPRPATITPQTPLERVFVAALTDPESRPEFRRLLLSSTMALALDAPGGEPRTVPIQGNRRAVAIFTSAQRLRGVLGPQAAFAELTGRQALTRLRGQNVVINFLLTPMLTLEPEDVAEYLAPAAATPAP